MRVLVADDEATNRLLLTVSVRKWGHEAVVAESGQQAWELLSADDPPRIALLDWMMPGMDGLEVCRRLRETAEPRLVYIIMVTTNAQRDDIVAGLEAGADDYVTKPFDLGELRARFDVGIRMIQVQRELAEHESALASARARLAEEQRLRSTVADITDGIITADAQWNISYANRAAQLLLNLGDAWEGACLADALAPFALSSDINELRSSREADSVVEIARTGTEVSLYLDGRLTRRFDDAGELRDIVLIVRDVTDQRVARNVEASFLNAISHKLRTPLAVLRGYLGMLDTIAFEDMTATCRQMVPICVREADRLGDAVERLLQFRDLSAEEKQAASAPLKMASVLEGVETAIRKRYPDKQIQLRAEVGSGARYVEAASGDVGLIVEELVDNAVKFSGEGPVRVDVQVHRTDDGTLQVSVTDNGPGIPHEYLDRVFQGYVQVEEHVTGQVAGLGLGLRIVKGVVERAGGTVAVHSDPGNGATVTVVIPLATDRIPPVI